MKLTNEIKPFNDIFYGSCYFMTLLHIVKYFEGDVNRFFVNDIYTYSYKAFQKKEDFVKCNKVCDEYETMNQIGICMKGYKSKDIDLIKFVIDHISKDCPVVVEIDTFYEEFRRDTYLKEHNPSALFIYEFDKQKRTFHVVEHTYSNSLSYQTIEIPFSLVLKCHKGFVENFDDDEATIYSFSKGLGTNIENRIIYFKNLKLNKMMIYEGLDEFNKIQKELISKYKCVNKEKWSEYINREINFCINAKRIEQIAISSTFDKYQDIIEINNNIINIWVKIRIMIVRYLKTKEKRYLNIEKIEQLFRSIANMEMHYYDKIFQFIER